MITLRLVVAGIALATANAQSPAKPAAKAAGAKPGPAAAIASLPADAAAPLFVAFGDVPPHHNAQALLRQTRDRVRRTAAGGLEVDAEGDGRKWTAAPARGEFAVAWWHAGRTLKLTFFEQAETWWVASTATHEAAFGDTKITCLDADADGIWWEPTDYLRWGAGAFVAQGVAPTVDDGVRAGALRLVARGQQPTILFDEASPPADAAAPAYAARRALNALRNACGMPPCAPWPEGDALLAKHAAYMAQHDPDGGKQLDPNFETTQLAGYDEAAASMAEQALVVRQVDAVDVPAMLARGLTGLRERSHLFGSAPGKVGFAVHGAWRAIRAVASETAASVRYVVLPAPGSTNAPTTAAPGAAAPAAADGASAPPRGVPISVRIDDALLTGAVELAVSEIAVFAAATNAAIAGRLLSVREIDASATTDHTWFFVPDAPLQPATDYVVRARIGGLARGKGGATGAETDRLRWQFRTAP